MDIKNEAFATVASAATVQALVLHDEDRLYTIMHTGVNALGGSDVNGIYIAMAPEIPDNNLGKNKMTLLPGMTVELGPANGPLSIAFKAAAGAPVLAIFSGEIE